ncbi:MAG: cytochrome C [Anaerolinea sp.]|nr:cytochrome C [Anaerolinea sp.]
MKISPIRWILAVGLLLGLGFMLIQLVPYGKDHTNPVVPAENDWEWDSPRTEALVRGACYDCHSNETKWPWYSNVAPMSWLVTRDVQKARSTFNFSEMSLEKGKLRVNEMVKRVSGNIMPPLQYTAIHSEARFSTVERQDLVNGLLATFK